MLGGGPLAAPVPNYHKFHGQRQFFSCYNVGTNELWAFDEKKAWFPALRVLKSIGARFPDRKPICVILGNVKPPQGSLHPRVSRGSTRLSCCSPPTYVSWANPIECQFGVTHRFLLKNCDYRSHRAFGARVHAYLRWRCQSP